MSYVWYGAKEEKRHNLRDFSPSLFRSRSNGGDPNVRARLRVRDRRGTDQVVVGTTRLRRTCTVISCMAVGNNNNNNNNVLFFSLRFSYTFYIVVVIKPYVAGDRREGTTESSEGVCVRVREGERREHNRNVCTTLGGGGDRPVRCSSVQCVPPPSLARQRIPVVLHFAPTSWWCSSLSIRAGVFRNTRPIAAASTMAAVLDVHCGVRLLPPSA